MVEMAGVYGDSLTLTCILDEGNITFTENSLVETGKMGTPVYGFAGTTIAEGDFVCLSERTIHTYANCGGLPAVKAADATDGWIGIVKSTPVWNKIPTAAVTYAAASLTGGTFRVASVVFPGVNMAFKALCDGGTPTTVGAPVNWDASENAFVLNGNYQATTGSVTPGGTFSFHYTNADDTSILVGVGMYTGSSGNTDMAAFDVQA